MNAQAEQLLKKILSLPPELRTQVEIFVDFLYSRERSKPRANQSESAQASR